MRNNWTHTLPARALTTSLLTVHIPVSTALWTLVVPEFHIHLLYLVKTDLHWSFKLRFHFVQAHDQPLFPFGRYFLKKTILFVYHLLDMLNVHIFWYRVFITWDYNSLRALFIRFSCAFHVLFTFQVLLMCFHFSDVLFTFLVLFMCFSLFRHIYAPNTHTCTRYTYMHQM